jgi:hypothetical protein
MLAKFKVQVSSSSLHEVLWLFIIAEIGDSSQAISKHFVLQ